MSASIVIRFAPLSAAAFIDKAENIVAALTGNPHFPEPWPEPTPALAKIVADLSSYQSAHNAVSLGDRTKAPGRDIAREQLIEDLKQLAKYLEWRSEGNEAALRSTGFDIHVPAARSRNSAPPPPPENIRLERGEISGTLLVRGKGNPQAASYEIQITNGDPTAETSWTDAGTFTSIIKAELHGLTAGKIYWMRARAIGSAGAGAWSPAVSLMVV